ncbi:MAG TPA: hypothetical protein VFQ16_08845 [Burkholderiaceae bacterium]|nr:hypothetical protein [Burkholderiaceae bacterium]
MSMARLFGRMRWGAVTAGWMAAALLTSSGPASAGIADTRHNLGSGTNAVGTRNQVTDTAEICVFCHTPHGGDTAAPVPLWNKRLGVSGAPAGGGTYTTYATLQTPSLDGTEAPVGSVSMACLSCHDGTQAMDNIINAPGSGGVVADGGGATGRTNVWTGSPRANGDGVMQNGGGFISMLGTDLSNDHPIGIQYCGGGLSGTGTSVSGTCKDLDFTMPQTATINTNQIFWVDTGVTGKQRTDLPLYVRASNNNGATGPLVECATCHDPHVSDNQTNAGGLPNSGATFLRISNANSAVCTSCHVK